MWNMVWCEICYDVNVGVVWNSYVGWCEMWRLWLCDVEHVL